MAPRVCDECGAETSVLEGHFADSGFLCDNCYFSKQPWHNDEDNGEGLAC